MSYRLRIQLAVLLYCFNALVFANERVLQVEIIVFQQQAHNTELFEQTESKISPVARYAPVTEGKETLQAVFKRLKRASAYQPFYYRSWLISVRSGQVSLPIEISEPELNLKGWIKIQRGNLLHIIADLEFVSDSVESSGVVYRLSEKRRVLLNEVHYLDHPFFGVVIKVSPVEPE